MKATADYAIKSAKERYGLVLDYSEDSLAILDKILGKIYWGLSSHNKEEGESGLVYNTAIIWGSYLGEYMCLKWGGTWTINGTDRRVSITSIEFSPITFVFQKITNHPEYSVENYVKETKQVIYTSVIHPKKSPQVVSPSIGQPLTAKSQKPPSKKSIAIDKRLMIPLAGILGILIVIAACVTGYAIIRSGGLPAFGLLADITSTSSTTPTQLILATPTVDSTNTPSVTMTDLPTYTTVPTNTQRPTSTDTPSPTLTATETETPTPTFTSTRRNTPVPTTEEPTSTRKPPPPRPTDTEVVIEIDSCQVDPSTISAGQDTQLTFTVRFSAGGPGYGFTVQDFNPDYSGQRGCDATDDNGDGVASCDGSSGQLPDATKVKVTLSTSLGNCSVSYKTP